MHAYNTLLQYISLKDISNQISSETLEHQRTPQRSLLAYKRSQKLHIYNQERDYKKLLSVP